MKAINEIRAEVESIKEFILTKEYHRFSEFASSCLQYGYIGICYGESGVGKSLAAKYFSRWDEILLKENIKDEITKEARKCIKECKGILITAPVTNTPKIIQNLVTVRTVHYEIAYEKAKGETDMSKISYGADNHCPLIIIDEADRLNVSPEISNVQLGENKDVHPYFPLTVHC